MIEFTDNSADVERAFTALGRRVGSVVGRSMNRAGAFHTRISTKELFVPYTGSSPADKLQTRTGGLRRSIGWETKGEGFGTALRVFAGPPARIQEYGGTITAKRSKYLTIPLRAALTAAGAPKRPDARSWDDAFILKARNGKLFIARRAGKALQLLYRLQESVRLPARFGFRALFRNKTLPFLRNELQRELAAL